MAKRSFRDIKVKSPSPKELLSEIGVFLMKRGSNNFHGKRSSSTTCRNANTYRWEITLLGDLISRTGQKCEKNF